MSSIITFENSDPAAAIEVRDLGKTYPDGTRALSGVNLTVSTHDFVTVIGSSGAGKSTLLRCMNRLIRPTQGELILFGEDIADVSGAGLRRVRRRVGMIFQQFHLVRRLTVLENVLVGRLRFNTSPVPFLGTLMRLFSRSEKEFAFECLKQVGIAELAYRRADALSGGQQQRVAIARALAQEPQVFLADEPIASLDPRSSEIVLQILQNIHETRGIPVIVNLHHIDFARRYGKRVLAMRGGRLVMDGTADDLNRDSVAEVYGARVDEAFEDLSKCA
jgi:phosphonate transport system ATP-binding protein